MAGTPIVSSPIAPSITRGGMTFTTLSDGVMLGFEPPPGFDRLAFVQQNGLSNITTTTDASGKQYVETRLSFGQYNRLAAAHPTLELPSYPPPNGNTEGQITRLPTVTVKASAKTSNPDTETETPEEDSYWWDYLKRSTRILGDEVKGFAGAAVGTVETVATGLGYLVTQPIESGKALVWGAGQVGGMVVEGLGHIVTQPAEVGKALVWGAGEVVDSIAATLAGEGAGKAVGGALFDLMPLPKMGTLTRGAGAEAKAAQEARLAQEAKAAEEARRAKAAEDANKGNDSKVEKEKDGKPDGPCKVCPQLAAPVNPVLGIKLLDGEQDLDFVIDGVLPLLWQRSYYSDVATVGWLGQGWSLPLSYQLEVRRDGVDVIDTQGRRIAFPTLQVGASFFSRYESTTLRRSERNRFELVTQEGLRLVFGLASSDQRRIDEAPADDDAISAEIAGESDQPPQGSRLPLLGMVDSNDNWLRVHYTPDDLPQVVELSSGRRVGLVFGQLTDASVEPVIRLLRVVELSNEPDEQGRFAASELLVDYRYSTEGDLAEVVDANGVVVRSFRWQNHMLVEHGEPGGLVSRYEWDRLAPGGRVLRNSLSTGESIAFAYFDADGKTTATDASGRVTTFCFDAERRYTGYIDAQGHHYRFDLDAYGNRLAVIDPLGRATRYHYDAHGNAVRLQSPDGAAQRRVFDADGRNLLEITDALDRQTHYRYDMRGNVVAVTDPAGATTWIVRDEHGLPVAVTGPLGNVTHRRFDAAGRMLEQRDCLGQATLYAYDRRGNLLQVCDALGQVTRYTYQHVNRRDRLVAIQSPDGAVERYTYDALGRLVAHHDALGHATRYHLDAAGRPLQREDAAGHTLRYRYDVHGRVLQLINENGARHRFAWDVLGRLVAEQGFDGRRQDYAYNAAGEMTESADGVPHDAPLMARGQSGVLRHYYQRDFAGRLVAKISSKPGTDPRPDVRCNRFAYDAAGQLIEARNDTAQVSMSYTAAGLLAEECLRTRGGRVVTMAHEYDAAGNRIATVLPDGRRLSHHRYGSGHVDAIRLDDATVCEFERDSLHRETVRSQGALRSYYERDSVGRLLSSRTRVAVPVAGSSVEPHRAGIARQYDYDSAGQLLTVNDARLGSTVYRYDATGRLLGADAPHARETFAFDPASNLVDPQQQGAAGQVVKRSWTEAEWKAYVAEHIHDPNFNPLLTDEEIAADPRRWGDVRPNRLVVYQQHRYRYDAWGNCVEKKSGAHETRTFRWNAEHQLASAQTTRIERGRVVVEQWGYDYDPFGRRIAKYPLPVEGHAAGAKAAAVTRRAVDTARTISGFMVGDKHDTAAARVHKRQRRNTDRARRGPFATQFAWDGNRLLLERRGDRQTLYLYEPDSFAPLALIRSEIAAKQDNQGDEVSPLPAELLSLKDRYPQQWAAVEQRRQALARRLGAHESQTAGLPAVEIFHVHTDHLGTPRELTDNDGHLVWAAAYKAWGVTESIDTPSRRREIADGNIRRHIDESQTEPVTQNLRFQGQYFDRETGLHYNRFRYYDPDVGRFVSQDPIGLLGGTNAYQYAPNSTGWIDPIGLAKCLLVYVLKPQDKDWRGTGKTAKDALDEAFKSTGVPRELFEVRKWGKNQYGKSVPVEYWAPGGAEVSMDFAHTPGKGPDAPHVGWQTPGKKNVVGHIILDDVPASRSRTKSGC